MGIVGKLGCAVGGMIAACAIASCHEPAFAQAPDIKIALITPLSGPMSRSGELSRMGAELAVRDINDAGGIAALGGAKFKLVVLDGGSTVETAKNAAQRLIEQEPDLVAGMGVWLSSHTLAATEVTERAGLPWITMSYSDKITERGFKYILAIEPSSSRFANESIPIVLKLAESATGKRPTTMGVIADSTLPAQSYMESLKKDVLGKIGLRLTVDETFTPPLSDATSMVQRVRRDRPDFLLVYTSNVADSKLIFAKLKEFGLSGGRVPVVALGTQNANTDIRENLGPDLLEGLLVVLANWATKKNEAFAETLKKRTGEPWILDDTFAHYAKVQLIKDGLERTKSRDRAALMKALLETDTTTGPADYFPTAHLRFDSTGRAVEPELLVVQWRNGIPLTVFPERLAVEKPLWLGAK